jgi:hypothetical protein
VRGDDLQRTGRVAVRSKREHLRKRKQFRASSPNIWIARLLAPSDETVLFVALLCLLSVGLCLF